MKKFLLFCASFIIALSTFVSTALAADSEIQSDSNIDPYIYELIKSYEQGTFQERNDLPELDIHKLLPSQPLNAEDSSYDIYDNRKIGENTYVASRISFYDLDKSDQNEKDGVTIYVAIEYAKKDFGDPWDYVMLNKVKGGVVKQDTSVSCSSISFRYSVYGDAYNSDGTHAGLKGKQVSYNGELKNPSVGTTYSISGPKDYYYNMGAVGGFIAGMMRAKLSNTAEFEVAVDITAI